MNLYFKLWIRFTVWMLKKGKFDYSHLSDAQILEKVRTYKQGWPWVEANLSYIEKQLLR